MVVPNFPHPVNGGLERQAFELSTCLAALGTKVTVLSYRFAPSHVPSQQVNGLTVIRIPERKFSVLGQLLTTLSVAAHLFRLRRNFDIVHVHTLSWFSALGVLLAKLMRKRSVIKLANTGKFGIPGAIATLAGRIRMRVLLSADAIVVMNGLSVEELRAEGIANRRIFFRPNGIRIEDHETEPPYAPKLKTRVVFLARLVKQKRCSDLLEAWKHINKCSADLELLIAGAGPERGVLEKLAQESGCANISFVGHISDIEKFLRSADILVLPSEHEGNSNTVLEGMRASLPIIATDIPGTRLQVGSEGEELLYPVGDIRKLAELIEKLVQDRQQRLAIGMAMRRRVVAQFDMSKVAADYAIAYEMLINCADPDFSKIGTFR